MSDGDDLLLHGISIGGYRSFGSTQRIGPLSKINVLIGGNNSGKSNILQFTTRHLAAIAGSSRADERSRKLNAILDRHDGASHQTIGGFGLPFNSERVQSIKGRIGNRKILALLDELLSRPEISHGTNLIWCERLSSDLGDRYDLRFPNEKAIEPMLKEFRNRTDHLNQLFAATKPGWSGNDVGQQLLHVLQYLTRAIEAFPPFILIPAVRQITQGERSKQSFDGSGIIDQLAELQNPSHHEQHKKKDFESISSLLRDVTGNDSAQLEIPHDRKSIVVHMDGKSLPLESLGTGIHEVIILAAACTTVTKHLICIEEPEIHLHPLLQRKLLRYLHQKTDNQYLITTHSAALLDTSLATIFEVSQQGRETSVRLTSKAGDRWRVCRELGYKASDLLQTNCIIWVEGPSDRIYLNHWIKALRPELRENIDYLIMFYGGRLLSHLSANDEEIGEFISLSHLNRCPALLMDSDKLSDDAPVNATKLRIQSEFNQTGNLVWITAGREIENYVETGLNGT